MRAATPTWDTRSAASSAISTPTSPCRPGWRTNRWCRTSGREAEATSSPCQATATPGTITPVACWPDLPSARGSASAPERPGQRPNPAIYAGGTMRHQHRKALRPVLGACIGFLLTSGLLAACGTRPASGVAGTASTAAGGHVYVTNQLDDTLSVINGQTNRVTATVPAGKTPESGAGTPDHRHLYTSDNGSGRGSVLNTRSNKNVAPVRVGEHPTRGGPSPD